MVNVYNSMLKWGTNTQQFIREQLKFSGNATTYLSLRKHGIDETRIKCVTLIQDGERRVLFKFTL